MPPLSRSPFAVVARRARFGMLALLAAWPAVTLAQTNPTISTLAAFSGSQTYSGPVRGPDGALYGVTSLSSVVAGGLVYRLALDGSSISTVYQLKPEDGYNPLGGLMLASDGYLYGTTGLGANADPNSAGTIFRLRPDGSDFAVIFRFADYSGNDPIAGGTNTDGASPDGELVEASDGLLYGIARAGGPNGTGAVYRVARDGSGFEVLHAFGAITSEATVSPPINPDGMNPTGTLLAAADGYLYGTASRGGSNGTGTLFRLRLDGTGFEVLRTLPALVTNSTDPGTNTDGAGPAAGLTDGQDGRFYGVISQGGEKGYGTLFSFDPVGRVFTVMHHFDNTGGAQPSGELLLAQNGALVGSTNGGGTNANGNNTPYGTIFTIARDGTGFDSIASFRGDDGASPTGRMLQIDASTFVGSVLGGARCGQGGVYQLSLTGVEIKGVTNCGRKKNNSGGGGTTPLLLLLLGAGFIVRRLRAA